MPSMAPEHRQEMSCGKARSENSSLASHVLVWWSWIIPNVKLYLELTYLFINRRKWNLFIVYECDIVIKVTVNPCVLKFSTQRIQEQ